MVRNICVAQTADVFPGITARNKAVLDYEKFVHRTFYPYTIHPYSRFRVYWEIFFLAFIPLRLLISTVLWIFTPWNSLHYILVLTVMSVFNMADIVLSFFTGYVEYKTEIVVLQPRKIVANYLLKNFVFDLVPAIPANFILFLHPEHSRFISGSSDVIDDTLFIINVCIILRAVTLFVYLYHTSNLFMWYPYVLGMTFTVLFIFMLFLFLINTGILYFFSTTVASNLSLLIDKTVYGRIEFFFDIVEDFVYYMNTVCDEAFMELPIYFIFLIITFFCSIFFMVFLIKYAMLKMKKEEKLEDLESRILSFARKRNLTDALKQKMLLYFRILHENKYYEKDEISHYIPDSFRAEITFHLCLPLLKNFYAFDDLPTYVLRRLAEWMVYQLYLPNELVMKTTDPELSMYFIQRGTLALYSASHVELYHFEAGSSINGRNMVLGDPNVNHYAISIEVTEVYRLDYERFMDIMAAYPNLLNNIVRKVQQDKSETALFGDYSLSVI